MPAIFPRFSSNVYVTGGAYELPGGGQFPQAPATSSAGAAPGMAGVANAINALNRTAQQASNAGRIPGATDLEAISSGNIRSELQGELPAGVISLLRQQAAERGVAGGFGGSPNETAGYLRALGLTSLDLTRQGQTNLTSALSRNPGAPVWDPSKLVLGAGEAEALRLQAQEAALRASEIASQNALRDAQRLNEIRPDATQTPWWVTARGSDGYGTPFGQAWNGMNVLNWS